MKNLNFVAGMTRRCVSAKRLIRYFSNSSKLVEHRAPVREVKMLAVWPSIAEGFPTASSRVYMQLKNCQVLVKNLNFVAGMTRRFVSAKRLIRYFWNSSKLAEHRAQSPVRKVKMLSGKKFQELAHKTGSWQFIKQVLMMLVTSTHVL